VKLKRLLFIATLLPILLAFLCISTVAYNGNVSVYVTHTGKCYHRLGCTYLKSQVEISLQEAVQNGYYRCSRCSPPILGQDDIHDTDRYYSYAERQDVDKNEEQTEEIEIIQQKKQEPVPKQENQNQNYAPVLYVVALIVGVLVVILALRARATRKKELALHEARCRGDLPGGVPGMPFGTIIGDDGLPAQIRKDGWGPMYTFYVGKSGGVFHKSPNCSRGAFYPVHAISLGNRRPCKKCRPILPNLNWFAPYKATKNDKSIIHPTQKPAYYQRVKIGVTRNGEPIFKVVSADNPQELSEKVFHAKFPRM